MEAIKKVNIIGVKSVKDLSFFPKQINKKGIYFYKDRINYIYFLEESTQRIYCYDIFNQWRLTRNNADFFIQDDFYEITDIVIQYYKICTYSNTIRLMPFNYWVASIVENELLFNSWDGMTKQFFKEGIINKSEITEFYKNSKGD